MFTYVADSLPMTSMGHIFSLRSLSCDKLTEFWESSFKFKTRRKLNEAVSVLDFSETSYINFHYFLRPLLTMVKLI